MADPIAAELDYLQTPQAIRDRSGQLFHLACQDQLTHFRCDLTKLDAAADYIIHVMQDHYPDLVIPVHSRWRHFEIDGVSLVEQLAAPLAALSSTEVARIKVDLAVTSVLLDAGAGDQWHYIEPTQQKRFQRSEGLAVASFHLFRQGAFSSRPDQPLRADAVGLQNLTLQQLATGFQVSPTNPLVGLEGRLNLLHKLGAALAANPALFGSETPRPGGLVDYLLTQSAAGQLAANQVLRPILNGFGQIWSTRTLPNSDIPLGDMWFHPQLKNVGPGSQLVPFHKLSQWLTYSLLEPLTEAGIKVCQLDELTGLAEYRNGGLCIDLGLIMPRQDSILGHAFPPDSTVIVEWRALTICLLDQLATAIRHKLQRTDTDLPLAQILQGGTWSAGRRIAAEKRPGGLPPIHLESDGTVF